MDSRMKEIIEHRRSIRKYTGEHIPQELLDLVVRTGLMTPRGKNYDTVELIVIRDRDTLNKLSECRPHGPGMLTEADCAIVLLGNEDVHNVWTEDCCAAITAMHLMADSLGLGSCWVQIRLRPSKIEGKMAEDVCREILGFPDNYRLEAMLALGMPAEHPEPKKYSDIDLSKIHYEHF